MTIRTAAEALTIANGTRVNVEGTCQKVTRGYYGADSAGDRDHDGDADAVDGWLSEPVSARHVGDRTPPAGYPVSFKGGSKGHGHRAISLGNGFIRSTDFDGIAKRYRAGVLGNGTIAQVEAAMGVTYLGWSETIDGQPIPKPATKTTKTAAATEAKPVSTKTYGTKVGDLFAQIQSLANQIIAATSWTTPNNVAARAIRSIASKRATKK